MDDRVPDTSVVRLPGRPAALRVAVVCACMLYIWGAPMLGQVFHVKHPYLRTWRMFSGVGLDVTQVRYWHVQPDGLALPLGREDLDRAGVRPPKGFTSEDQAVLAARKLCAMLGAGADVRLELRAATRRGWETRLSAREKRCRAEAAR